MLGWLIDLYNHTRVSAVGIGDIILWLLAKTILEFSGEDSTHACGKSQLHCGLSAGIKVGIHSIHLSCTQHYYEEGWGFILIGASNSFADMSCMGIMWTVRHLWLSIARFNFKFYWHHTQLFVVNLDREDDTILSRWGVTQGDPLAMVVYGMGFLPLIKYL